MREDAGLLQHAFYLPMHVIICETHKDLNIYVYIYMLPVLQMKRNAKSQVNCDFIMIYLLSIKMVKM